MKFISKIQSFFKGGNMSKEEERNASYNLLGDIFPYDNDDPTKV
jgi:hypothetical protein